MPFTGIFSFSRMAPLLLMLAGGGVSIAISHLYTLNTETFEVKMLQPASAPETRVQTASEAAPEIEIPVPAKTGPAILPDQFNLAFSFPEGADGSDPMESRGASVYASLSAEEAEWMGNIYNYTSMPPAQAAARLGLGPEAVTGKYNRLDEAHKKDDPSTWLIPDWKQIHITMYNGDRGPSDGRSNLKEILSMASVYTYYHDYEDEEAFLQYARQLWQDSHSFHVSISDIYYCDGCIGGEGDGPETATDSEIAPEETAAEENVEEKTAAEAESAGEDISKSATPSEISLGPGYYLELKEDRLSASEAETEAAEEESSCPGHVDLNISIYTNGLEGESKNLYVLDRQGNTPDDSWPGWTDETKNYVSLLMEKDWAEEYGLRISQTITTGIALGTDEISEYMDMLPDGISQTRKDLIRFALESVGKVPYYWGGKPAAAGYAGNQFGSVVSPDESGRIQRGLDCSGWISWVYWSATGNRLPYESTAGLVSCGTGIEPEQLQPGDILIRREEESHVVMFLAWGSPGNIICIHESSEPVSNVTVEEKPFNWQYCRKLVE